MAQTILIAFAQNRFISISLLAMLLCLLAALVTLINRSALGKIQSICLLMAGYHVADMLIDGRITQLLSLQFYRYDGKFLVLLAIVFGFSGFRFTAVKQKIFYDVSAVILACVFILEYILFLSVTGPFESHNASAGYLSAFIIYYYMHWKAQEKHGAFTISMLFLLTTLFLLLESRAFVAGVLGAIGFHEVRHNYGFRRVYKLGLLLILIAVVIVFTGVGERAIYGLSGEDYNVQTRLLIYQNALTMISENLFFGAGYGAFNDAGIYVSGDFVAQGGYFFGEGHAHNIFLHVIAEQGLVGMVVYFTFFSYLLAHVTGRNKFQDEFIKLLFITLLIASQFGINLITPSTAILFYVACIVSERSYQKCR